MKRFINPLIVAAIGLILSPLFPWLGHYLVPGAIPSTTEYWTLSDAAYNISAILGNGGTYQAPPGYTLVKVSTAAQLSHGFAAAALGDANGNVIIANEGTLPGLNAFGFGSAVADIAISKGNTPLALTDAQTFAKQVEKILAGKTPIFVTGHSLGGIEAEAEAKELFTSSKPTNAAGGATFGATGLPGQQVAGGPANLIDYVDHGDPIGNDASDTGTQNPFAPATPMYHYGTVVMEGPVTNAIGLETASYLKTASADTDQMAQYGIFSGEASDEYWLGALSLLAKGLGYHRVANYATDLSINPGSAPVVPLDSLDEAIYALGEPLWKGDESNLGSGTENKKETITTPDFAGSDNTSTDQFTVKQTANITDVSGTIVSGGTTTLTLNLATNLITQEKYVSPDGTTYHATLNSKTEEFQTLEANEANGASYQIQYTYNSNGLSSIGTTGYSGTNLSGTLEFTQTTNYNAKGVATSASISGTGDIATLDNATITIASNAAATTKGNTINGSGNTISLGTNDNITVAAATGEKSFTDTINAASSVADFTTDTITFEGESIAGNFNSGSTDKYGRKYVLNGTTLTITYKSDSLTITKFQNGDFGVVINNSQPGKQDWRYQTGAFVDSTPAVVNGVVYVGSSDDYVYALDASKGTLIWRYFTESKASSPTVVNSVLYVGSAYGYVYALSTSNGTLLWDYQTGNAVSSSPVVVNGVVYIGSQDYYVYALNVNAGTLIWRYYTKGYSISASPAVANGIVYVGDDGGHFYALNASSGTLNWSYQSQVDILTTPVVANGVVYVGFEDVYALNASSGTLIWSYGTEQGFSSPTVANGIVYVGSDDGYIYAIYA